jgi:Rrf2 family iron-sulfur cluster assembly transcriptional regulator
MRLTTKGRLAVVAMIDVALHHKAGPIALAVVAATRGPGGGYTLGRDSAQITVADILFAVDSPLSEARRPARDAAAGGAPATQRCTTPELWDSLNRNVVEFLDSVTLRKLADDQIALGVQLRENEPAVRRAEPVRQPVKPTRPNAPNSVFELGKFGRLA